VTHPIWGDRFAEPVVAITADQDWAPEWALAEFIGFTASEGVPLHVFVTNASETLDQAAARGEVTLGVHPNFLRGSTHGEDPDEVIAHCRALVPPATTFRTHSFHENSHLLQRLRASRFVADSNVCLFLEPDLVPQVHAAGTLRFPVFFEDDSMLRWLGAAEATKVVPPLFHTPGLKVVNVHPALFAMNAPNLAYYDDHRDAFYSPARSDSFPYRGAGVATVMAAIVASIRREAVRMESFEHLANSCREHLATAATPALARWLTAGPPPVA
jgi:hypothetical protein